MNSLYNNRFIFFSIFKGPFFWPPEMNVGAKRQHEWSKDKMIDNIIIKYDESHQLLTPDKFLTKNV